MAGNLYDDALESLDDQQQQQQQPPANPYLETIDAVDSARTRSMRTAQVQATTTTPDRAAEVSKLSGATGLAPEVVERNFDDLSRRVKVESTPYADIQAQSPKLAEWASDAHNAAVAHDDMENLGLLEWIVSAPQKAFAQSVSQMRLGKLLAESLYRDLTPEERDQVNAEKFASEKDGAVGAGKSWFRGAITGTSQFLANILEGGISSAPQMAIGAGVGGLIGGTAGSFAGGVGAVPGAIEGAQFGAHVGGLVGGYQFTFQLEAGLAYDEYKDFKDELGKPLDPTAAKAAALATGAINAGLEVGGLEVVLKTIPGLDKLGKIGVKSAVQQALRNPTIRAGLTAAVKEYAGALTAETSVEVAQRAVTILAGELGKYATGTGGAQRTSGDIAGDLAREAAGAVQSFAVGLAVGPAFGIAHQARQAERAKQSEAFFQALSEGVGKSKLVERLPEAAQAFLEHATAGGPVANVYAPIDTFREYWQSQKLDPKEVAAELTGSTDAYETAERTGEDLVIPTARYAVKLAGTPHAKFFSQELRTGPDEMNGREALAFQEELKAAQEAAAQAAADKADGSMDPALQVRNQVAEQLIAAGVPAETAGTYAQLYEGAFGSMSERAGVDPAELYARYGLTVQRPDLGSAPPKRPGNTRVETPTATFLAYGPSGPLYNIQGGDNHGSTVSPEGLQEQGIAVPETPADTGERLTGDQLREKIMAQQAAAQDPREQPVQEERRVTPGAAPDGVERRVNDGPRPMDNIVAAFTAAAAEPGVRERALAMANARRSKGAGNVDNNEAGAQTEGTNGAATATGDGLSDPATEPLATPQDRVQPRGREAQSTDEGAASRIPPSARERYAELAADARERGYSGSDDTLAALYLEQRDRAATIAADLEQIDTDTSWRNVLTSIAKMGGISLDREKDGGYSGEVRWLMESLGGPGGDGVIKKGPRAGKVMPRNSAGIEGAAGVFKRSGGISLDQAREQLQQDPGFEHLDNLSDFMVLLEDAVLKGYQENQRRPVNVSSVANTQSVLEGLLGVKPGEDWWAQQTLEQKNDTGGPSLFSELFDPPVTTGAADVLETGEVQPRLPGAEGVREQEVQTAEFDAPFALTPESSERKGKQTTLFQSAYHGSPHKFEAFTLQAIGSGEGAQAYGWGLYFASKKEVAEGYRERLSGRDLAQEQRRAFSAVSKYGDRETAVATLEKQLAALDRLIALEAAVPAMIDAEEFDRPAYDAHSALRDTARDESGIEVWHTAAQLQEDRRNLTETLGVLKHGDLEKPGRLFTVEIPDDEHFLLWDVPIEEQSPKLQATLELLGFDSTPTVYPSLEEAVKMFSRTVVQQAAYSDIGIRASLREGHHYALSGDEKAFRAWFNQHGRTLTDGLKKYSGNKGLTGERVYEDLGEMWEKEQRTLALGPFYIPPTIAARARGASEMLSKLGVAGIKYLDGFSRQAGEGTYNFVVFDDKLVEVTSYDQKTGPRLQAVHQLSAENLAFADQLGGIPAPSIAVMPEEHGALQGYGDITLLGTRDHGDPTKNPVFDADIYSATFPQPEYRTVKSKIVQPIVDRFRALATEFDERRVIDQIWDNAVNKADPRSTVDYLRRSPAAMALFLQEKGIEVKPVVTPASVEAEFVTTPAFQEFLAKNGGRDKLAGHAYDDTTYRKKLAAAIRAGITELVEGKSAKVKAALRRAYLENYIDEADGLPHFGRTIRLSRSLDNIGRMQVDTIDTRKVLEDAIRDHAAEFQAWVDKLILPMYGEPALTLARKKVAYTLANITAHMTANKNIKAVQEGMTFGEGKARADAAVRITDLEEARNRAEWQIKPEAEVNEKREVAKKLLEQYRTAVLEHYTETDWRGHTDVWRGLDSSMRALARWSKGRQTEANLRAALRKEGFANVTPETIALGMEAGKAFLEAPVPYFESKPQRSVSIGEFPGAVIPTTATEGTRAILEKHGVQVEEYDPNVPETRDRAMAALRTKLQEAGKDVLFAPERRGNIQFGADRQMTINLLERADLSTFLHESGHFFLEVFGDLFDKVLEAPDPSALNMQQRQLLADYGTLLEYLGVTDRGNITEAQHEKMARSFEAYLMTGEAPSLELRTAFARFRAWLTGIYRTLKGLDVKLSKSVTEVFDRMLASDKAIAEAAAIGHVAPMFLTPEMAGMSDKQFDLYRRTVNDASIKAREALDRRLLSEVQREQEQAYKDARSSVEADVTGTVQAQPVYRAIAAIKNGTNPDGSELEGGMPPLKLSKKLLVERFGKERLAGLKGMYSVEGGLDPDPIAELFGFSSGDEMLQAIAAAVPMKQAIEQQTNQRMLDQFGSILLDGTLHEQAQAALSNEDRELVIRQELRALAALKRTVAPHVQQAKAEGKDALRQEKKERAYERRWFEAEAKLREAIAAGKKQIEIDELQGEVQALRAKARGGAATIRAAIPRFDDIRAAAQARIARTRYRDLNPGVFWSASRRAATKAIDSAARQEFDDAIAAKQQELLNLALYREAMKAKDELATRVKAARDLAKPAARSRLGLAGEAYLDQVDGILDRFEFAQVSKKALDRRASLRKFVAGLEGEGLPVDMPEELLEESRRVNFQELTVDELTGILDGLDQILHLARLKNKLLKNQEQRELAELAGALATSIRENKAGRGAGLPTDRAPAEERSRMIADFFAGHRKLASMLREMDGFKDGGPAWDAIMRPLNEAGSREAEMQAEASRKLSEIVDQAYPGRQKSELYRKQYLEGVGQSLSKMQRLMVAFNWGNEGNRDRVRRAFGWDDGQVQSILDTLDARDAKFIQGVLDFIDGYWPEIEAKQKRVFGVAPDKVEAAGMTISGTEIKGGYFPLKYDDRLSAKAIGALDLEAANLAKQAAYAQATTKRGHTMARVARVKMPVRLDFGVLFGHVQQVIHDLSHHEALIDVGRILGHGDVQTAILETHGDLVYKQIRNTIRDVAFGDVPATNGVERSINHLRVGATVAGLGWNLTTTLMQPIGLTNSIVRIGPKWVAKGLSRWLRNPFTMIETVKWMEDSSAFMRSRARTQQREINEIRSAIGISSSKLGGWVDEILSTTTLDHVTRQGVADSYFWFIQQAQRVADIPTWLGQYEKSMAGGETHERAVSLADQAVLDSQGGGQTKDLAQVQRGGPMFKLWTNFYSYFNVVYNQAAETKRSTDFRNPVAVGRAASDYLMLFIVPATLSFAIKEAMKPSGKKPGDDDDTLYKLGLEYAGAFMGTMVGLREVSGLLAGVYGYEGPAGTRAFSALGQFIQQAKQGELDEAFWKRLNDLAGILFHYPAAQVGRTVAGAAALAEGKTKNPAALIAGPSKEAK